MAQVEPKHVFQKHLQSISSAHLNSQADYHETGPAASVHHRYFPHEPAFVFLRDRCTETEFCWLLNF